MLLVTLRIVVLGVAGPVIWRQFHVASVPILLTIGGDAALRSLAIGASILRIEPEAVVGLLDLLIRLKQLPVAVALPIPAVSLQHPVDHISW